MKPDTLRERSPLQKFGDLLREIEAEKKYRPVEVAWAVGYNPSYYYQVRAGQRFPSRDFADALALTLELSPLHHARLLVTLGYLPLLDDTFRDTVAKMAASWGLRVTPYQVRRITKDAPQVHDLRGTSGKRNGTRANTDTVAQ